MVPKTSIQQNPRFIEENNQAGTQISPTPKSHNLSNKVLGKLEDLLESLIENSLEYPQGLAKDL